VEEKAKFAKKFEDEVNQLREGMITLRDDTKRFENDRDTLQAEKLGKLIENWIS